MKLTKTERWILSNQYRILEKLDPDQERDYARGREVLESGYALEYGWISEHLLDEFPVDECREVIDILDMCQALRRSYEKLGNKSGIEEWRVHFRGFDGNEETGHMAYARYLTEDEGKFQELRNGGLNSHCPTLDRYRSMLSEWERSPNKSELTREDLVRIAHAR